MAEEQSKPDEPWTYDGPTSLTITFDKPLKMTEKDPNPVGSIELTEPLLEQYCAFTDTMAKTNGNEFEAGAVMIAKNTGLHVNLIKKMTGRDFAKAQAFFMGFTSPPPKGGAT